MHYLAEPPPGEPPVIRWKKSRAHDRFGRDPLIGNQKRHTPEIFRLVSFFCPEDRSEPNDLRVAAVSLVLRKRVSRINDKRGELAHAMIVDARMFGTYDHAI